ncbi:DUF2752 domain-containing protein [Streptomyces sp. NPDC045431]|uniref:DUF2752 domain-containing protein n=1 Tax=Streptomyces sp. NPDC045431 TaxID=3155613 RepID=UPI0033E7490C
MDDAMPNSPSSPAPYGADPYGADPYGAGPHTPVPPASGPPAAQGPPHAPTPAPAPPPLVRRLAAPVGTLAAVAAAFAYVGAVDPNEPGHYPVCPLLRFTGLYCPGCGGLRSAHAFIHGDLAAALGANAVAVAGYVAFAVLMALWLVRAVRAQPVRIDIGQLWVWSFGALLVLFAVVRNLPFGSALAP